MRGHVRCLARIGRGVTRKFDIVVAGAGPAGANAALAASKRGGHVALIDEHPTPGGQVWRSKSAAVVSAPMTPEMRRGDQLRKNVRESGLHHFGGHRIWQIERHETGWVLHCQCDDRVETVAAKALVLATGALEYVQPIPGWTTPGVIGLAGATVLCKQELCLPGQRTVICGTGPLVFLVASEVRRLGGTVAAVVTPNRRSDWLAALPAMAMRPDLVARGAIWLADLALARVPIFWGHGIARIAGRERVASVVVQGLDRDWAPLGRELVIEADSVCLGNRLIPSIEAAQLAGLKPVYRPEFGGWCPESENEGYTALEGLFLCGDGAGIRGAAAAAIQGSLTGEAAGAWLHRQAYRADPARFRSYRRAARFGEAMAALSFPRTGLTALTTPDTVVCRCEGVTRSEIEAEIANGAASANAVKSGLRAGMGPCGGKFCQTAVAEIIAAHTGKRPDTIVPPTPRPPLRPVPIQSLTGDFGYDDLPIPEPAPL